MMILQRSFWFAIVLFVLYFSSLISVRTEIERFPPRDGQAIELWRVTNDPSIRDHASYHNIKCWSPDGRYMCFTHYAADEKEYGAGSKAEIHIFDFLKQQDIRIDLGTNPRWANQHNWLFYTHREENKGPSYEQGVSVIWYDVESQQKTVIGYGLQTLKETDCGDRWIYGIQSAADGSRKAARLAIQKNSTLEILPGDWGVGYNSLYVNPVHPTIVSRDHNYRDYYYTPEGTQDIPFMARHFFDHELDGTNRTVPFPLMDGSHFAWDGSGTYFMAGNGPVRGRKWNEPLPSNIHFLSNISVGDICACGRSGRWICGSTGGGRGPLQVADLRSGDGWTVTKTFSFLCFPNSQDNSGPYDIDAKGSPDGTKIAFISTYDLKDGPAATVEQFIGPNRIVVDSTQGFPSRGRLVNPAGFGGEALSYERITPTTFEGITRGLYKTSAESSIGKGQTLLSFESLLLSEEIRNGNRLPSRSIRQIVQDMESPLMWQRSSDIYIAVVRLPDRPVLRVTSEGVELIPGENHWETQGYNIYLNGVKINDRLYHSGETLQLLEEGKYAVTAVEWSGLESALSQTISLNEERTLHILHEIPNDFSWTRSIYRSSGQEIEKREINDKTDIVEEIVHQTDGVIHRRRLDHGKSVRQIDLNSDGKPIRHLYFKNDRVSHREYYNSQGDLVSKEIFNTDGQITESIRYERGREDRHWWYENGIPIKYVDPPHLYIKKNDIWIKRPME